MIRPTVIRLSPRLRQWTATGLAITFGIVAGIDFVGTPLAIVAINHAASASNRADHFSRALSSAVIRSRYEDCQGQEKLRALGRIRLEQKEREAPAVLRLLHVEPTPYVRALQKRQFAEERQSLVKVDCNAYARKASP